MGATKPIIIGRYLLLDELASGGMATVFLGRLLGPAGFSRTVAIKRLHPHLARDPEFVTMLLDEARLAGRIQHPHVAATLDVVAQDGELFVVMEYLHGETLGRLLRVLRSKGEQMPPDIASAILTGALYGLHAAHEVRGERGEPLNLVHRDISPQNIMIRQDGVALVLDFGIAKAAGRIHETEHGKVKGKLPYMATEQVRGQPLSRRTDIYAAGAVLWEALVGERLVRGSNEGEIVEQLLFATFEAPSTRAENIPPALDAVVARALSRPVDKRFTTAREMALALEEAMRPALPSRVASWLEEVVGPQLEARASRLVEIETSEIEQLTSSNSVMAFLEQSSSLRGIVDPPGPPAASPAPSPAPAEPAATLTGTATSILPATAAAASAPSAPSAEPAAPAALAASVAALAPASAAPPPSPEAAKVVGSPATASSAAPIAESPVVLPAALAPESSAGLPLTAVATPAAPSTSPKRLALGVFLLLLVAAGAFALGSMRSPETDTKSAAVTSASASAAPSATSAASAAITASVAASTAPATSAPAASTAPSAAASTTPAKVPGKKTLDCSDVRVVLPNGHITYRRECLNH